MTTKRTNKQHRQLFALCNKLRIEKEQREELVYKFTNGRETSSAEMLEPECDKLIAHLHSLGKPSVNDPADKMRKKILSICHDMHWETPSGKIDWSRLNNWLAKYGYMHKSLNSYTLEELPTLVTQFERLQKDGIGKI